MDDNRRKKTRSQIPIVLLVVGIVGVFYCLFGCPIKYTTGLSCPGCGMTRAALEAATLHFDRAFQYHPLLPLVPVGLWLMLSKWAKARPKLRNIALGVICAVFILTWLVRLFLIDDPLIGWNRPQLWQDFSDGFARLRR